MGVEIKIKSTGLIYRNPKPYLRAEHAYFPSVVRFSETEMLATFVLGSAFESVDCKTFLARSVDSGESWDFEGQLRSVPDDRSESCRISILSDGQVIALINECDRSNPEVGLTNPENLGFVPTRFLLMRSQDNGKTWSFPFEIIPPLVGPCFELCSPIIELVDGRLILPTSTWRGWDGSEPNGMKAVAFISYDRGQT